jgi:uncharacterized protein YggT (Ycf19 family)
VSFVDFILNLAGLLLWINWRSTLFDPFNKRKPATLVGTLRRAAPTRWRRWHLLVIIGALLALRAVFYWQIGSAVGWIGRLDLGVTTLFFRSDHFPQILLFSVFSFVEAFAVLYFCLLLLSILSGPEPVHRLVRIQLGRIDGWATWVKFILPFVVTALIWGLATWPFAWLHPQSRMSAAHRIEESVLIGLGSYLVWKFIISSLLILYMLNSYIYFGRHPFWNYVNATGQTLLSPLRKIPLRVGKADFTPVVGLALIFLIAQLAERGLIALYAQLPL